MWGDVSIGVKQTTYTAPAHEVVFSIRNNSTEVATLSANTLVNSQLGRSMFTRIHVKLDDTTGLIQLECNGAIHTAYTGQNTVQTTALSAASAVFIGPPVLDNGTAAFVGVIDNVYIDDASWPAGRPEYKAFTLLADSVTANMVAFGTSPTTIVNALSLSTDAKAMKALVAGASAVCTITPPTTTPHLTDVLAIELVARSATSRVSIPVSDRRLAMGYDLSGVETMGTILKSTPLAFSNTTLPPENSAFATNAVEQIFLTSAAAKMTKTELATMKVVFKSSSP